MKKQEIPALTGPELIDILISDGWQKGRKARHGLTLTKKFPDKTRVTFVPTKKDSLPPGTLSAILGPLQTGIGKKGLRQLLFGPDKN